VCLFFLQSLWLDQVDAALLVPGEEITLMGWGNAIIKNVHHAEGDASVVAVDAALHLEGDFKKTKLKLTWLADTPDLVPLELHHFGYLLTKKKLEEEDDFHEFVNKNSVRNMLINCAYSIIIVCYFFF
jgi:glutamyl-tRNA synthetase